MPSHVIRDWRYDAGETALFVRFVNGRRYRYDGVPAEVAEELRLAFAKGSFFNRRIRGRYPASPVASEPGGEPDDSGPDARQDN